MSEAHKKSYRHPKYKTAYRISNWPEYEKSLRDRGDITIWFSEDAIDAWRSTKTGNRGGQLVYSDIAIETALTLRCVFHLALRQSEGFLGSILKLMGLDLPCPDHTTLSRRGCTIDVRRHLDRLPVGPACLIVDSTGLKICGQGEWHSTKHGDKRRRRWRKLHIGVDESGWVLTSAITDDRVQDPSQVPDLLAQVDGEIDRFVADGIYDREPVYVAVLQHSPGCRIIIPPRKDAVLSGTATDSPSQRDLHVAAIQHDGRPQWKRESGYYRQSHAENAFFRYKKILGGRLRTKRPEAQEREAAIGCAVLNRMLEFGRPQSYPVG